MKNKKKEYPAKQNICSNILVTGCGGDIGTSIGKILKMEKVADKIIGCDIHKEHSGIFIFDKCEVVDRVDSSNYLESISKIIKKYNINLIIPMSEPELRFISEKRLTEIAGISLIIPNKEALKIGFDKLETSNFLKSINLPNPWTSIVKEGKPKEIPCIIKNRFGSGSKTFDIINEDNLDYYSKIKSEDIFQEYLRPDNEEYTCGLYRTKDNEIRTIIFKRKLQGGYTGYGEVVENKDIENTLIKLAEEIKLQGSINVQLRLTEKGPVIFEINPRFSSTVLFRHLLGFKDVIWMLKEKTGTPINPYKNLKIGAKIYKGFQEYVLSTENTDT